ncbi:MAG: hypothetical protein AB8F94_00180 [Saprospiraceae bacterium]
MKNFALTICLLLATIIMNAQQSLLGIWNTGEYNAKIEISKENGVCNGKILSSDNANAKIGNQIIKDVKLERGLRKGKWYDVVLKPKGKELEIKIAVGFIKKTLNWTKE